MKRNSNRKVLLVQVKGTDRVQSEIPMKIPPLGLSVVANIFKGRFYLPMVWDLFLQSEEDLLKKVEQEKYDVIGFGGISTSYGEIARISGLMRNINPEAVYIAGGPVSSTYDLLLEDGAVDYVFHGETEVSLPKFLNYLDGNGNLEFIGGISYLKERLGQKTGISQKDFRSPGGLQIKDKRLIYRAPPEPLIKDMDEIGYMDYSYIDANLYKQDLREWYSIYKPEVDDTPELSEKVNGYLKDGKIWFLELPTSRGCTHRCTFCYRHVRGIRRHKVSHVVNNVRILKEKYDINGINFTDELFNSHDDWVYELCDALDKLEYNLFYFIAGARANKLDERMLKRLYESGFIEIGMGHESGSEEVLKHYKKGISRQENIDATLLAKKCGLHPSVQIVLGSPAETTKTVLETAKFFVEADVKVASINYLIPLPETPVWDFVTKNGYVTDVRAFLNRAKKYGTTYKLKMNMTKSNDVVWIFWKIILLRRLYLNRSNGNLLKTFYYGTYLFLFGKLLREARKTIHF